MHVTPLPQFPAAAEHFGIREIVAAAKTEKCRRALLTLLHAYEREDLGLPR
jgi:hypothetical protein